MVNIFLLFVIGTLNMTEFGNNGFRISFSIDEFHRLGKDYSFPGAIWLNNVGEPDLPSCLYKIGIPQNADVEVEIIEKREEVIKDVIIEPVVFAGIYEAPFPEIVETHAKVYKENKLFPQNLIEVSKPGYFRDIYKVDVRLNPVRYNPVSRELRIVKSIEIFVRFKGKPKIRPISNIAFEEIYKRTIVNYEQCKRWRRDPVDVSGNPFAAGVWFKIEVDEEGLYKIGFEEIKAAGLDPAQFDPRTMKIYTASFDLLPSVVEPSYEDSLIEVPVYVEGENDHSFDINDYLIFYGFPASHFVPDSEVSWYEHGYARNNAYWFTFGGDNGERMEKINAQWDSSTPDTVVNELLHFERDISNPTRSGTNWYWQDVSPGDGESSSFSTTIYHPRASGQAEITVGFFTLRSGRFLYRIEMDGTIFYDDTLSLPPHNRLPPNYIKGEGSLSGDSSVLIFSIIRPIGETTNFIAYFNSIDLQYERLTDLSHPFHGFFQGQQEYSIRCANTSSTPFLLDITDIRSPKVFYDYSMDNNTLTLSSSSDSFQMLYFSKLALAKSATLLSVQLGKLREQSTGCDYLVITHKDFYQAIRPLVEYRSREYSTKVVVVGDIYNDFSFGRFEPLAIKYFLYNAWNSWLTAPKYVLLVGDGTYDYKNNLNKEKPPNFIPMYDSGSILSGNAGIPPNYIYEGEYVNFGDGEVMVLGRITVRTKKEVDDFIDKLLTYETKNIDGMWNKRIILAGDDEFHNPHTWEGPKQHCGTCEDMLGYITDSLYDIVKLYMVSYPPFSYPTKKPNAQEAFIRELNKGGYMGVFFGHGNSHQLADEGLFYDTNIPRVKNGRKYFFYYFGSCTVGRFDDSDYECIAEQFVRIPEGAIGTFAATAGTGVSSNKRIGQELFRAATDPNANLTMGECCLIAKDGLWGLHYLLIGDPATKMRKTETLMGLKIDSTVLHDTIIISGISGDTIYYIKPLEELKITTDQDRCYLKAFVRDSTHIEKFDASTADKISGHVYRLVQSGIGSYMPFDYEIDGKEIYHGFWDDDTAIIIVPRVDTAHVPIIKISSFVHEKSGLLDSTRILGAAAPSTDQTGPRLVLYDRSRKLKDGDWVDKEFTLTGRVSDESGINLLNSVEDVRGFYLYMSQDLANKIDLRDYFIYDRNSYTEGEFNVDLTLPDPVDTLTINVTDNYYNQTTETIVLNADISARISIDDLLIYPNPLKNNKGLWFTFDLSRSGVIDIKIFTIAGRLIKTIENVPSQAGYNQIYWNTLDEYLDEISNGVYLVKTLVSADDSSDEIIEKFIVAR